MTYDYVGVIEPTHFRKQTLTSIKESNYEFDPDNEEPYWEPSSREDELKMQLQNLGITSISETNLRYGCMCEHSFIRSVLCNVGRSWEYPLIEKYKQGGFI